MAEDANGKTVERREVPYDEFYEGGIDVVDSNANRATNSIRRLKGEIYDSSGSLQEMFDNRYSEDGRCLGSRITFADGTTVGE
jgi:hypothetical protein